MPAPPARPRYRAYLLRCWEERPADPAAPGTWRFGLEDPRTGARQGFADLAALIAYLEAALAADRPGASAGGDAPDADLPKVP
jgi:hypothetical protein